MWKQKQSLYKTTRRKAVILKKIIQLRTDKRSGGRKIVSHVDKLFFRRFYGHRLRLGPQKCGKNVPRQYIQQS